MSAMPLPDVTCRDVLSELEDKMRVIEEKIQALWGTKEEQKCVHDQLIQEINCSGWQWMDDPWS